MLYVVRLRDGRLASQILKDIESDGLKRAQKISKFALKLKLILAAKAQDD